MADDGLHAWVRRALEEEVKVQAAQWDQPVPEFVQMGERCQEFQQQGDYGFSYAGEGPTRLAMLAWLFLKIISCCGHLRRKELSTNGDGNASNILIVRKLRQKSWALSHGCKRNAKYLLIAARLETNCSGIPIILEMVSYFKV
ncbi:hypothetical protein L6164_025787 [Bauhinia variegata]|uniref:Uncharacterized protein n=1 Tax=Bauhinia variegata TaxID=167791 RepID=A0ACB9M1L9_BAUVA|nr:hypothetical protein L6164_025787 [Bauhinia variegata]